MASDIVHAAEILVNDLPTKSITFAPARATVVREIQDVQIMVSTRTINPFPANSNPART